MPSEEDTERVAYLQSMYSLYHGHINGTFNFFLVAAGLVGNAFILSYSSDYRIPIKAPFFIASLGILLSIVFLLMHIRSRQLLDTIESGLRTQENRIFGSGAGFLNYPSGSSCFMLRHKYQFPIAYSMFAIAFIGAGLFAWPWGNPLSLLCP